MKNSLSNFIIIIDKTLKRSKNRSFCLKIVLFDLFRLWERRGMFCYHCPPAVQSSQSRIPNLDYPFSSSHSCKFSVLAQHKFCPSIISYIDFFPYSNTKRKASTTINSINFSDTSYSYHSSIHDENFVRRKQRRNRTTFTLQQVN